MTEIILWTTVGALLVVSFVKNREKTRKALKMALKQFLNLLSILIALILFLGMARAMVDPDIIGRLIGPESGVLGVVSGIVVGSVMLIPGFVAFPLAAGFLKIGAGYPQVAGFVAALMGVGISTAPLEIKYFGIRLTVLRNLLCLITAICFVVVIWGVGL